MRIGQRFGGAALMFGVLLGITGAVAPHASADRYGQPCSDPSLVEFSYPPTLCGGDHWERPPVPQVYSRQTLGAPCSFGSGTTSLANDTDSGSVYFAMCSQGAWTRLRP